MSEKFPGLRMYAEKLEAVFDGVRDLSIKKLESLLREIEAVSTTNCGWSTYQAGALLRSEVEWALRQKMNDSEAERNNVPETVKAE